MVLKSQDMEAVICLRTNNQSRNELDMSHIWYTINQVLLHPNLLMLSNSDLLE
ncbi:uncharacterized protein DS421_17g597480 [Arachis hypogaea]|nr:uncharacterized protein DS421_16g546830 [Arachis hypogaea]QHN93996.1 uncharacterized protein DS421_17g597480 [Arachis hypogaea]